MSYDFLSDLLVLEVAQFGPDALGGYLADMGARVIKVEAPGTGDPLRYSGAVGAGGADGFCYMHLRWNRGKQSLELDIATSEGAEAFRTLARQANVVIEGMRAGALDRCGLGYADLRAINPRIVFASISGMGRSGPYARMASHGPSFDAFGGLGLPCGEGISKYEGQQPASVGMHAVSLHGALGVLSAVHAARRTGEGALIEVAAAESAAHWLPDALDPLLNAEKTVERPGYLDGDRRMRGWARMENYRTRDNKLVYFMSLTDKSWRAFLQAAERPDLEAIYQRQPQNGFEDRAAAAELAVLFATRDRADWLERSARFNAALMPVNSNEDVLHDPHFRARGNIYQTTLPDGQTLDLMGTPVRAEGKTFAPKLAPTLGQHNDAIRREFALG